MTETEGLMVENKLETPLTKSQTGYGWAKGLTKETSIPHRIISEKLKGRAPWNKGKKYPIETREKMRGKKHSLETRKKMSEKRTKFHIEKEILEKMYIEELKSTNEIAKECQCSDSVIFKALKYFKIPTRNISLAQSIKKANKIQKEFEFYSAIPMSPDYAKIIGYLLGDGGINQKGRSIYIRYMNPDLKLMEDFIKKFYNVFGKRLNYSKRFTENGIEYYTVDFGSIACANVIQKKMIHEFNENEKIAFLQALFDDEGSVSKNGVIKISQTNKENIERIRKYLIDLDIICSEVKERRYKNKNWNNQYEITITHRNNLRKFLEKIDFLSEKKHKRLINYLKRMGVI